MVAILTPRRLRELLDVTQPGGTGLPDQGVPVLHSSNSYFVIETIAGGGGGSFSLGASNIGNTLGDTGVTGSRVVLAGIGNLTLSQATDVNGGTISISAGTAGAGFSLGASGGNTAGDTGATGTRVVLAGGNNITLSQATNVNGGTITISGPNTVPQSVQTQNVFDLTLDGNTSGALALVSSGTLTLAGGSHITLSQNGNAVTIIGDSVAAETQTAISGIVASNATYTSGTVTITGAGNITVASGTGQRVIISGSQSVQAETQTFVGGISASNTNYTSGTVNIVGSGIVTVQSGTGQRVIINASQSVQPETQTFLGGLAGSNTTYTSGTVTLTGVGGGVTVNSNTGQRIDISVAAPVAQTVQTQNVVDVTLSGNTSGALALISSGTMTIAGGNNITVSQAGNAFTISGANAAGAQTGISGIGASNTTYSSGTVVFTGVGGGITVSSNTGQRVDLSVAAQTVESQSIGMSNLGNTSGTTGIASGGQVRFLFAGAGEVTLSQSLNGASGTLTISSPVQTAESQSIGMSNIGNTSGTTGIASGAQVRMLFAGGNNVTLSQSLNGASGTLTISAASQTVQTQNLVDVTMSGNTSGAGALISSGTLTLAGGNNITISQAGNALTISGPNVGGAQTGISGLANSQTTYTSGTVSMSELGAITIRSTTGNQYQFSVNAQTGTQFSAGISGGNTSGDTGTVGGRVVFAGGNNVTLSGSTNGVSETITISAFNQSVQTQNLVDVTLAGNTSGALALISSGTMTLAGGNNITLSQAGNAVTISAGAGGGFSAGMSNIGNTSGDTGITGTRLVLAGGNNITLSQSTNASGGTVTISAFTQSAESQSIGMSNLGNTSGTTGIASGAQVRMLFAGGNNITLSQSLNGASGTLTISGPNAQTGISGIANSQTTYTSGTVSLSELGAITIRSTTGNQYQFSVAAQTAQTGISGIANSQTTYTSGTVSMSELGAITIRSTTGNQYQFSVAAQTVESQSIGASNLGNTLGTSGVASGGQVRAVIVGTSNITVSQSVNGASATMSLIGQPSFSAGLSTGGNTQGNTGISGTRLVLVATNNITMSQATDASGATISISGQSPTGGQFSAGVSTGGNTAGSTGISGSRLVFVGTNAISLSQSTDANGATVSINDTVSAFQAGISTIGNTAGDTGVTGTRLVLVGSGPVSLSGATGANGGTVSINAPATSSLSAVSGIKISTNGSTISVGFGASLADWENMPRAQASLISHVSAFSKTPIYWNDHLDGDITAKSMAFAISMVTASQPLSVSAHLGVYTLVNSTSAALLGSLSEAYVVSSASSVSLSGVRNIVMTGIGTHATLSSLTYGEYLLGMMFSATATNAMNFSLLGASGGAGALGGIYPGTNNLSTGTGQGIQVLAGRGSTTVNVMPANVSSADLVNQGQGASMPLHPWIYIRS